MSIPAIIAAWGVVALIAAAFSFFYAGTRGRSGDQWAFAVFLFPPLALLLFILPRNKHLDPTAPIRREIASLRDD